MAVSTLVVVTAISCQGCMAVTSVRTVTAVSAAPLFVTLTIVL
jgi:hypothetical protein